MERVYNELYVWLLRFDFENDIEVLVMFEVRVLFYEIYFFECVLFIFLVVVEVSMWR